MADFVMTEMPDVRGEGTTILYPRMIHTGQIDTDTLAAEVHERTTYSTGDVKGLIEAMSEVIASQLALGHSVKVDGLGTFTAGLKMKKGIDREEKDAITRRNAASVEVAKVNYRADNKLVDRVRQRTILHRKYIGTGETALMSPDDRIALLRSHIAQHGQIRVKEYATLTGLEKTRAAKELRQLESTGIIHVAGRAPHIYYYMDRE